NSELYAYSGFFTVLLAFGLETGFFRFYHKEENRQKIVFSTGLAFLTITSLIFIVLIYFFNGGLAALMHYQGMEYYIICFGWILALDALGALPFALLRAENKPIRFAAIKFAEIAVNIGLNLFFLVFCRKAFYNGENNWLASLYNPDIGVGYIFISNLAASAVKVLLLSPQLMLISSGFDATLLKKMLRYSLPMTVIGFAGIINEMLDRMSLKYLLSGTVQENLAQLGIYSACYKLSILMNLFIQAFRYAAEPFFFAQASRKDSPKIYADVLLYFTIFCVFIFLMISLFLQYFGLFIGQDFRSGLSIVPILLIANMFFGIYTNLSIWYKLTDRTLYGALVALLGAAVTIVLLWWWVPRMGYHGAAWATLGCYIFMTVVSYILGQKYFPVPYNIPKVLAYILFGIGCYLVHKQVISIYVSEEISGAVLLMIFIFVVLVMESKNFNHARN
ncbi:MAG: polysaccharide biosynthesis C-terminal domain-containing protein, partial [Chitinophagales bacterium]|nr:polysaccharide biosynthesis C-terminal domain-containing protein [Chitinophagales bacterium]